MKVNENLILNGQTGTGKTWLACAFGRQAARLDHSVLYVRMPRLFEDLAMARRDCQEFRVWAGIMGSKEITDASPQRTQYS